ncbi:uncharacterized protein TNCV_2241881 [Trichonephila clavipes]|nr:uncharacterized protein TNCV_2241881 [Trichonephila clavipes]
MHWRQCIIVIIVTGDCSATRKRYIREQLFGDLKYGNCFFMLFFLCVRCLPVPRGRHRTSFDQVSEYDRGRIVASRDCKLSFREIGQRVGRNQAIVRQIYHRWMQEETTDRRG